MVLHGNPNRGHASFPGNGLLVDAANHEEATRNRTQSVRSGGKQHEVGIRPGLSIDAKNHSIKPLQIRLNVHSWPSYELACT